MMGVGVAVIALGGTRRPALPGRFMKQPDPSPKIQLQKELDTSGSAPIMLISGALRETAESSAAHELAARLLAPEAQSRS